MNLYDVTVVRIGSVKVNAKSWEEAMTKADETSESNIEWLEGFSATDAELVS